MDRCIICGNEVPYECDFEGNIYEYKGHWTGNGYVCYGSSNCYGIYQERQKKQFEEWGRQRKEETKKREEAGHYDFRKCDWCGKTYCRAESTAINKGVYCCKRCEAKL